MKKNKTQLKYCHRQLADSNVHQIFLYGDVTDDMTFDWNTWEYKDSETSAMHFKEMLDEIPAGEPIELYINSNGGDVDQGTAIHNLLKRHGSSITGYVDGVCHSIAFTILQACDKRVMNVGTSAIIHNMWTICIGNANDLRAEAERMDQMMESCYDLFMDRGFKGTREELKALMDAETALSPTKALEYGLIDEVGNLTNSNEVEDLRQQVASLTKQLEEKAAVPEQPEMKKNGFAVLF